MKHFDQKICYYFEAGTKNFHYINVETVKIPRDIEIKTEILETDYIIPPNHRSVMTEDGTIYLIGGYDPSKIE